MSGKELFCKFGAYGTVSKIRYLPVDLVINYNYPLRKRLFELSLYLEKISKTPAHYVDPTLIYGQTPWILSIFIFPVSLKIFLNPMD